jgi:hypothetical protein
MDVSRMFRSYYLDVSEMFFGCFGGGYRKVRFLHFFIPPKDVLKMVQGLASNMKNTLFFAKVSLVYVIEQGDV